MMDFRGPIFRCSTFLLLFVLLFVFACSTPSWFPIKKGTSSKAKTKDLKTKDLKAQDLADKEIMIIDKEEYVKVYNPKAAGEANQPKYLYIPVNEYLSKRETFASPPYQKDESKKEKLTGSGSAIRGLGLNEPSSSRSLPSPAVGDQVAVSSKASLGNLKKKVLVIHFDDRAVQTDETFGDWIAERLIKEMDRRSPRILFVDYQMVKEFLEKKEISLDKIEAPHVLSLISEVFGVQILVLGYLSGPYTFTNKGSMDPEVTASAIIKIETKLIDTLTGRTLKNLESSNPILATKMKGSFSEEKAKVKAIDVAVANLSGSLSREIDSLDWFCRIAKIEGEQVYLNAGKLTGLKVGDVMEVFHPGKPGERGEIRGKVRISTCFGVDASVGDLIQGKAPEVDDVLRFARHEGT